MSGSVGYAWIECMECLSTARIESGYAGGPCVKYVESNYEICVNSVRPSKPARGSFGAVVPACPHVFAGSTAARCDRPDLTPLRNRSMAV